VPQARPGNHLAASAYGHAVAGRAHQLVARFESEGVEGVGRIAAGRGRRSWLPEGTVAAVVHDTLHAAPDDGSTHWSTRLMAKRFGIGKDTVARIWADHNLKPQKVDTFKVSNHPHFEDKLLDVVGLYLDPPQRAIVFRRNSTTDSFAAMNVVTGEVLYDTGLHQIVGCRLQHEINNKTLRLDQLFRGPP
jgi:hypothetical protein